MSDAFRLLNPFIICQINDDTFSTSDGRLISASVGLGSGKKNSNCTFSIFDKEGVFADKYLSSSISQGGIKLPDEFYESDSSSDNNTSNVTSTLPESAGVPSGNGAVNTSLTARERAMLDVISYTEGTTKHSYYTFFGGSRLDNLKDHPKRRVPTGNGDRTSAAGRYQFLDTIYATLKNRLNLPDFGPESQDLAARELIRENGALNFVNSGDFERASRILAQRDQWTSLPGGDEDANRRKGAGNKYSMESLKQYFEQRVAFYENKNGSKAQNTAKTSQELTSQTKEEVPVQESSNKGTQITVAISISPELWEVFTYVHTKTTISGSDLNILSFEGQSIRGLMETRIVAQRYTNITLKQLATYFCNQHGCKLIMDFEGPKYDVVTQLDKSDRAMLLMLCQAAGYYMYDEGPNLIIKRNPAIADKEEGFVIRWGELLDRITITDTAQTDSGSTQNDDNSQSSYAVEPKTSVNTVTGQIEQRVLETKAGLKRDRPNSGMSAAPLSFKGDFGVGSQTPDPSKNYKEYTLDCEFSTTQAALTIKPLQPIYIEGWIKFGMQKWYVDKISHTYREGILRTSVNAFIPIVGLNSSNNTDNSNSVSTLPEVEPTATKGDYGYPIGGNFPVGEGIGPRGNRTHKGIDIPVPSGTPVLAMANGVVVKVLHSCANTNSDSCNGDAGNWVVLKHPDGKYTKYMHLLDTPKVEKGQNVKKGEQIGFVGNSGRSSGPHLHFEIRGAEEGGKIYKPSDVGLKFAKPTRGQV